MDKYYCECCKYITMSSSHMNKHVKSKKHVDNHKISNKTTVIIKTKIYNCSECNAEFINRTTKWRHEQKCKKPVEDVPQKIQNKASKVDVVNNVNNVDKVDNADKVDKLDAPAEMEYDKMDNKILITLLQRYESKMDKYESIIENLSSSNKSSAEASNKTAEAATKSMSILKYATLHMSDAPPLTEIDNEEAISILGYKGEDKNLSDEQQEHVNEIYVQLVIAHYTNKNIVNFLSDMIVAYFRKPGVDYKKLSSIWAVDVARLSFIIMSTINKDGEKEWRSDKTGKLFKSMVIKPMLKALDAILQQYIKYKENWHIRHKDTTVEEMGKLMLLRQGCVELSKDIRYQQFERQLIKYVAPSFQFDEYLKK
jgi:hypothetical protein